jgi:hypothetical protein
MVFLELWRSLCHRPAQACRAMLSGRIGSGSNEAGSRALRYINLIEILRNKVHHE